MITDLYHYNDWANHRIFQLCSDLTDNQLDEPRPLGLGSLRATLFHLWAAEQIWLERWQGQAWREFPIDPQRIPMGELQQRFQQVSQTRWDMIRDAGAEMHTRKIRYLDWKKNEHSNRWYDLLVHVANHGIHHRAQSLQYLKRFGRTVPGGLDYLFYKIANPSVQPIAESIAPLQQMGLTVAESSGRQVQWLRCAWQDFFAYHDWAIAQLWPMVSQLNAEQSHRDFQMGVGSIHKTCCHLRDAEKWWLGIWDNRSEGFPKYNPEESWDDLRANWQWIATKRNACVASTDETAAIRVVIATPGQVPVAFRVAESMLQLCGHGTHHRAQLVNMLRQLEISAPALDYVVWARLGLSTTASLQSNIVSLQNG